jgi:hypothetical protein
MVIRANAPGAISAQARTKAVNGSYAILLADFERGLGLGAGRHSEKWNS